MHFTRFESRLCFTRVMLPSLHSEPKDGAFEVNKRCWKSEIKTENVGNTESRAEFCGKRTGFNCLGLRLFELEINLSGIQY